MQRVLILGATGSIGLNTIDVISAYPDRYKAAALVAHSKVNELAELALIHHPEAVGIYDESKAAELKERLKNTKCEIYAGENGILELIARGYDITMAAIVGIAGLTPTVAAIQHSQRVCLANKETLVCAGELINQLALNHNTKIIPVDSEHSAILQIFEQHNLAQIKKITLTASGGPFRNTTLADMANVTPQAAIAHPNWKMGAKISLDCATLLNKGLEYIETCLLFPVNPDQVDIVIHYESIIHSLVSYQEGSTLAHMGYPDMRTPIALSLSYPFRLNINHKTLDLAELGKLHFAAPDYARFPLLKYSKQAMRDGLAHRIVLNAANEEAGIAFFEGKIKFLDIANCIVEELDACQFAQPNSFAEVLEIDKMVRHSLGNKIKKCSPL